MSEKIKEITQEQIESFIEGTDPMEKIVNITYKYQDDFVTIYYRNEEDRKCTTTDSLYPFVWATLKACKRLCNGDKDELKQLMQRCHIGVKKLSNVAIDGTVREEFNDGYMFMFFAKQPMSYSNFLNFFKWAKNPVYAKKDKNGNVLSGSDEKQYLIVTPVEQYLIQTGRRFFKGYDDYNQILRMIFDLETEGLDTEHDRIKQLGISLNRPVKNYPEGFKRIFSLEGTTKEEKDASELQIIHNFCKAIAYFKPDVLCGHNIENFDIPMLIGAAKRLGTSLEEISAQYFDNETIHKENKETILKLGGEIETYTPTSIPNTTLTDSLHAVRRAQAMDSNMKQADLKYATKYSGMVKPNRVYTPGDKIDEILSDTVNQYAFNDKDGDWYVYDPVNGTSVKTPDQFESENEYNKYIASIKGKQGDNPFKMRTRNVLLDGYEITTGKYIVERYLYDDLYEGDKVEWKFNSTNFLICKMLPIPYKKCTTMGTAGQWKSLLLAWSYMHNLAVPMFREQKSFTGGLSRLIKTGKIKRQVKLDYNSLYPSIILTWGIGDTNDLMDSMLKFLEYILTTREKYKGAKKVSDKKMEALKPKILDGTATPEEVNEYNDADAEFMLADGKQMQMKVLGNSFFGSYGAPNVFPWGSTKCAEMVTCCGRMCLRLIICHFTKLGYEPVVGDSVTGDTPLFIRWKDSNCIDIKPISEIFDESKYNVDGFKREYDYSEKPYEVLCRSGWVDVNYVYRHSTDKDIYRITNEDGTYVDVTKDHSLFTEGKVPIKPTEITSVIKLEESKHDVEPNLLYHNICTTHSVNVWAKSVADGNYNRIPIFILNSEKDSMRQFYDTFMQNYREDIEYSKTCLAGLKYIKSKI